MIAVRPSEVPDYLQDGSFFQSLDPSCDDYIQVPSEALKADAQLNTCADLEHLLTSLSFWGIQQISYEIMDFILANDVGIVNDSLVAAFPLVAVMQDLQIMEKGREVMNSVIKRGSIFVLDYLLQRGYSLENDYCTIAVQYGQLEMLIYFLAHGCEHLEACKAAFEGGNMVCLEYFGENGYLDELDGYFIEVKGSKPSHFKYVSVPDVTTLQYALKQGLVSENLIISAAEAGNLEILTLCHTEGQDLTEEVAYLALCGDHLDCLKYIHCQMGALDESTADSAVTCGSIRCLQYAWENGFSCSPHSIHAALVYDHLDCLKFLHEKGFAITDENSQHAAIIGSLNCLQYALEHNGYRGPEICHCAARLRRVDLLIHFRGIGCDWDHTTTEAAADSGSLECLQYACRNGCRVTRGCCALAAGRNHLECLQYLRGFGCNWSSKTPTAAAQHGALDCLKYAVEHSCQVAPEAYKLAKLYEKAECMTYLEENNFADVA